MNPLAIKKPSLSQVLASLPGITVYLLFAFGFHPETHAHAFYISIGVAALLINLWIAEPIPLWLSSLLPLILLPMHGLINFQDSLANYYNKNILLFLGGFLLAYSVEKSNLHKRIAFKLLALTGDNPKGIIAGMMLSTCLISMWISNTATAIMMLPVAISITNIMHDKEAAGNKAFFLCLMLGIAYAANIGGVATIIGTPPNIIYKGYVETLMHSKISFLQWMIIGVPLSLTMLWLTYQLMVNVIFKIKLKSLPEVAELLDKQAMQLGKMSTPEKRSLIIFSMAAFCWIFSQPINSLLKDQAIDFKIQEFAVAMVFGLLLFLVPKEKKTKQTLLVLGDFKYISWGILVLFGGGMCMAKGLETTGVIKFAGEYIQNAEAGNFNLLLLLLILSALFLTELMSNVALAQIYIPVVFGISQSMGSDNPHIMGITVTIASSFAFMFPISTPPNAVVFSSGKVKIKDMAFAGFFLNIVGVILLWLTGMFIIPYLF